MIYIRAKVEVENQTEEMELEIRDAILHAIKNNPKVLNAKVEVVLPSVTASTTQSTGIGMKSEINYYAIERASAMAWWNRDLTDQERDRLCVIYGEPITGREIEMIWRNEMTKKLLK